MEHGKFSYSRLDYRWTNWFRINSRYGATCNLNSTILCQMSFKHRSYNKLLSNISLSCQIWSIKQCCSLLLKAINVDRSCVIGAAPMTKSSQCFMLDLDLDWKAHSPNRTLCLRVLCVALQRVACCENERPPDRRGQEINKRPATPALICAC